MKKLVLLTFLVVLPKVFFSQGLPINEIIDKIRQVDLFVKYGMFKDNVENELKLIANDPKISSDDYKKLYHAYDSLRLRYNRFLDVISSDLSKWSQIKAMIKNPDNFASKYMNEYESVLKYYTDTYKKIFVDVENNVRRSNGEFSTKNIGIGTILVLIQEAKPLIQSIVRWIKNRRDEKDEAKNTIIAAITDQLFKPLEMKRWDVLVKNSPLSIDERKIIKEEKKQNLIENEDLSLIENSEFKGSLYFTWCTKDCDNPKLSDAKKIEFRPAPKRVKSVTVSPYSQPDNNTFCKAMRYNSVNSFEAGYMQLELSSTAAIYVFAYNTAKEKKIEPIFPFPVKELKERGYTQEQIVTKSITVTPFFNSSNKGTLTIPAPAISGGKEIPLFMNVTPDSDEEYIVVLISKKQLPDNFYQEVEDADGSNLETRLFNVLGNQLVSSEDADAKLNLNEGLLNFDASNLNKGSVLGLIFVINH